MCVCRCICGRRGTEHGSAFRYNEELGGVPVAYAGLRLAEPVGRILRDQPHVLLRVHASLLLFTPTVGRPLGPPPPAATRTMGTRRVC
jgi:hypothetical protein